MLHFVKIEDLTRKIVPEVFSEYLEERILPEQLVARLLGLEKEEIVFVRIP